ncbi:hypothetical protein Slala04_01910 [Streptomyces lavendulae subsp. lavendulae]|nr:hypothetical protein Slala04_01910 [Streptomyces lavendulae subsp. lavendulae]
MEQAEFADAVGKGLEFLFIEHGEEGGGRVGFYGGPPGGDSVVRGGPASGQTSVHAGVGVEQVLLGRMQKMLNDE